MLLDFFFQLRDAKIPVTVREYLTLLEGMKAQFMTPSLDNFYHLSRLTLVKDERFFDRFDQVFGNYFKGLEKNMDLFAQLPKDWLEKRFNREFTPEEMAAIEAMGGLDKLMERLKELLKEQKERHEGGSKWIGSGGTSPFGNNGYNPEGVRMLHRWACVTAVRILPHPGRIRRAQIGSRRLGPGQRAPTAKATHGPVRPGP